jgi:hypothetical protein
MQFQRQSHGIGTFWKGDEQVKLETLNKKIEKLEKERESLFLLREPIDKMIERNYKELDKLREQRGKIIVDQMPKDKIDFNFILTGEHHSMPLYYESERQIQELGLRGGGKWTMTGQKNISLTMYKNDPDNLQKTYDSVLLLLPYMIPFPKEGRKDRIIEEFIGKKVFGIFEHTLSENGIYYFLISENGNTEIGIQRYSRFSILKEFKTILDGLKYVQNNLYYEEK